MQKKLKIRGQFPLASQRTYRLQCFRWPYLKTVHHSMHALLVPSVLFASPLRLLFWVDNYQVDIESDYFSHPEHFFDLPDIFDSIPEMDFQVDPVDNKYMRKYT